MRGRLPPSRRSRRFIARRSRRELSTRAGWSRPPRRSPSLRSSSRIERLLRLWRSEGWDKGSRVTIRSSSGESLVTPLFPSGIFCIDFPLVAGENRFEVGVQNTMGESSSAMATVWKKVSAAATPPNATCSEMAICAQTESCGNGPDDDCDGFDDRCDVDCNGCSDDDLQPNSTPYGAPEVDPKQYSLALCPCLEDWFSFNNVKVGETLQAQVSHPAGPNVSVSLYRDIPTRPLVANQYGTSGHLTIQAVATDPGKYLLRVRVLHRDQPKAPVLAQPR